MNFTRLSTNATLILLLACAGHLQASEAKVPACSTKMPTRPFLGWVASAQPLEVLKAEAALLAFQCMAIYPADGKAAFPATDVTARAQALLVNEIPTTKHPRLQKILKDALAVLNRTKL